MARHTPSEFPPEGHMVISGTPGSGKTTGTLREALAAMRRYLRTHEHLTPEHALALREDGYAAAEIARQWAVSTSTVYRRLKEARASHG